MNEIISKWNEDITDIEEFNGIANAQDYISNIKGLKIIDLKHLKEINKDILSAEFSIIIKEINKELYDNRDTMCIDPEDKLNICNDYCRCLLCILDYLIDTNRLKVIVQGE